jgi:hypothetical protein
VDRRTRTLFLAVLLATVALASVAVIVGGGGEPPRRPDDALVAEGVVVGVDGEGLGNVRSFRLRTAAGGEILTFDVSRLQNVVEFPPSHLAEHQVTAEPIRVRYRAEAGIRYAIHLEDASR